MFPRLAIRVIVSTIAAAWLLATGFVAVAQEGTPSADTPHAASYPVSIHAGTCDNPTAQPIGTTIDTEVAGLDGGERVGISDASPVLTAHAEIDGTLDDLTGTPHVVAVHASADDYGTIVACGEIAGYVEDGRLVFALRSVDGSVVSGIAILDDQPSFLNEVLRQIDVNRDIDLDFGTGTLSLTVLVIPGDPAGA
jgi:hypothetical protein